MQSLPRRLTAVVSAAAAVAALAFAAVAPTALAGTVAVTVERIENPKSAPFDSATATWTAAPGEANRLTVLIGGNGEILLSDGGAPLTAGDGCRALTATVVSCPRPANADGNSFAADAGDGDDVIAVTASDGGGASVSAGDGDDRVEAVGAYLRAYGGAGADVLVGGDGNDGLDGGAGSDELRGRGGDDVLSGDGIDVQPVADLLDGGAGAHDSVSYDERDDGVVVDLATGTGGPPGEGDRLAGVEDLVGGDGADVLRGDDGANELDGGHGADVLEGRGGDDELSGMGPDVLGGRGGDDDLSNLGPERGDPGTLRIDGGDGDDRLLAYGRVDLDAGGGDDYLWGHGVGPFRCGAGRDRVEPRKGAIVAADCERILTWLFTLTALRAGAGGDRIAVTATATGYPRGEMCGVDLTARAGGRLLARAAARVPSRQPRRLRLVARAALPATVRLGVGSLRCDRGRGPRFNPETGRDSFRIALR